MLQWAFGIPPGTEVSLPTAFERFAGFLVLYFFLLALIAFALPRPWSLWCFRALFPFMPERRKENDHD